MKKFFLLSLILTFITGPVSWADELPAFDREAYMASAGINKRLELTITDCVAMALKNNSEILVRKIVPLIEDSNVRIQKAVFEPDFSFDYIMEDSTEMTPYFLISRNPAKDRTNTFNFGIEDKLVTGTEIGINFYNMRSSTNSPIQDINPSFDVKPEFTIRQPLLKGAGIVVNKADFLIAKNNKLKSVQDFTGEVINTLTNTKKSYYEFQYTQEQYKTALISLKRIEELHYINKEKYSKGLASNVDLLQSEAEVARLEEAVVAAEEKMKLAEDDLKYITNLVDNAELWNASIVLLDEIRCEKKDIGIIEAIEKAFIHRPDYEYEKIELKNRDISVVYYKNGVLPTLDLIGSFALNGLAKNYGKALAHVGGGKYQDWSVGVSVNIPIGNDDAIGKYEKSKYEKEQALIKFKRLEQKIILQVRDAVRKVDAKYKILAASRKSMDAQRENYAAQETRFKAGLVSTLDILIYQEDLTRAELNYIRSAIDYNESLIELAKAQGTTLIDDNIKIEEEMST